MKISRKEYLLILFGIAFVVATTIVLSPLIYIINKWDEFWNKKIIELNLKKCVNNDNKPPNKRA